MSQEHETDINPESFATALVGADLARLKSLYMHGTVRQVQDMLPSVLKAISVSDRYASRGLISYGARDLLEGLLRGALESKDATTGMTGYEQVAQRLLLEKQVDPQHPQYAACFDRALHAARGATSYLVHALGEEAQAQQPAKTSGRAA